VVLISIDTLRSDHLPAYGYRPTDGPALLTPAIDALAADGTLFERAFSHYPLTLPSHASIFSGLLPPRHGVRDNSGYRLGAGVPHLARDLSAAGYATGGAVSAFVLRGETGLGDGFDLYDDDVPLDPRRGLGGQQRPGADTLDAVLPWLRRAAAGERPFFLFLHLYEPHSPYAPPPPFAGRYASPYDGEIAAADAVVGRLVGELRRLGVYRRALVILLSDHGEGLGDHGEAEHGVLLYREALQVPLIVKLPDDRGAGRRVRAAVPLTDVYPTVADLAGLPGGDAAAGRSLADPDALRPQAIYAETFYPRLHFGWSELASLIDGGLHYVHGPRPQLFDLTADAAERHDVLAARRRDFAALRQRTRALLTPLAPPAAEDADTARRLAALGYLGGAVDRDGPRPDPRARLPVLADLQEGMRLAAADRFAEAADRLAAVTAAEPEMVDAWETLARARRGLGELEPALAAYRRALALSPAAPQLALGTAAVLLDLDRPQEAAAHARLALAQLPAEAHEALARAALAQGDTRAAAEHAAACAEAAPGGVGVLLLAAEVQEAEGDLDGALRAVDEAAAAAADGPPVLDLERLRGHLLARQGHAEAAAAAFEREIAAFPAEPRAYDELALLRALEGRPAAAVATLRRLLAAAETPRSYAAAVRTLRVLGDPGGAEALRRHGLARFPASSALRAAAAPAPAGEPAGG